jgi:hypothetical protein
MGVGVLVVCEVDWIGLDWTLSFHVHERMSTFIV